MRLAEEAEVAKATEEQKKREAREQRAAKEAEREVLRQQRDPNQPFTDTLGSKSKPDLQDVAQTLGLATDGQKKVLLARIKLISTKALISVKPHDSKAFSTDRVEGQPLRTMKIKPVPARHRCLNTPSYFAPTPLTMNIVNSLPSSALLHTTLSLPP